MKVWRFVVGSMMVLAAIGLTGCNATDSTNHGEIALHVYDHMWSGWSEGKPSEPRGHVYYPPKVGDEIFSEWEFVISVDSVSKDKVTLKFGCKDGNDKVVKGGWSVEHEGGGISLSAEDGVREYTLKRGESVTMVTQTMDAGWVVTLECK